MKRVEARSSGIKIRRWESCRLCGSASLSTALDFGPLGLPKWPLSSDEPVPVAPLEFCVCGVCGLGQLRHSIDREGLFRDYWYRSGVNSTMREHLAGIAAAAQREARLQADDLVVDIGANDGTLLRGYGAPERLIGFEPSALCPAPGEYGIQWVNDFFHPNVGPEELRRRGAKIVTSISMFYYLDDPIEFAKQIRSILSPDGIWVCEMNYALSMVENRSFDHISHEHVTTWSAQTFARVIEAVGLELFRIDLHPLNGGSIRFWMGAPRTHEVERSVVDVIEREEGRLSSAAYMTFASNVRQICDRLRQMIQDINAHGERVMTYGASTRGLTILSGAGIDHSLVEAAAERNLDKVGRLYGATKIPIISEEEMRLRPPDFLLVLPYSFLTEFISREAQFLRRGGRFIVPIPEPRIIDSTAIDQPVAAH